MKCVVLLVTTAMLWQLVIGNSLIRRRRGYFNLKPDISVSNSQSGIFNHSPWWRRGTATSSGKPVDQLWTTPTTTESTINAEVILSSCIQSCPVAAEYNPVCGSNNVTYPTLGRLQCEQRCGVAVQLSRSTACSIPVSNTTEIILKREEIVACLRKCPMPTVFKPVCGSNNVTYANRDQLECERNCGITVQLSKHAPCIPETTTTEKTLSKEEQLSACLQSCNGTAEHNPVCGSNNVTYVNRERLECEQNCGILVHLSKLAPCTPEEEQISACEKSCRGTTEYYPVCGSNNVTYANPGRLECAQKCGVVVQLSRNTSCSAPLIEEEKAARDNPNTSRVNTNTTTESSQTQSTENNCNKNKKKPSVNEVMACMQMCALTSEYNPVCGTDDITYSNPGRLLCAQFCGVDVNVRKFAPCLSNTTTNFHCPTFIYPAATNESARTPNPPADKGQDASGQASISPEASTAVTDVSDESSFNIDPRFMVEHQQTVKKL